MIYQMSKIGAHHLNTHGENQDAICVREADDCSVVVLADGVSSCTEAKRGAELVASICADTIMENRAFFMKYSVKDAAKFIILAVTNNLTVLARGERRVVEEYSSTLLCVFHDKERGKLYFFNIGDGMILAVSHDKPRFLARPMSSRYGCFVTTTWNAEERARSQRCDVGEIESVLLCTDGAWHCMYDDNGHIKSEAKKCLETQDYKRLEEFLMIQDNFDDCSFIAMDVA